MTNFLRLDGGQQTLLFALHEGPPTLAYWGPALPENGTCDLPPELLERPIANALLDQDEIVDLFPEAGRGFTAQPALECRHSRDGFITQLHFTGHYADSGGHIIMLQDDLAKIEVQLNISMDPLSGVAGFRSIVRNLGTDDLELWWVSASCLPSVFDDVLMFSGRWTREFEMHRQKLVTGAFVKENRTGRTSHHAPPFLVVGETGFGEHHGHVLGIHLAWSGDHRMQVERLRNGRVLVQAGELFAPGEVILRSGESYESPWLYAARSDSGLNGLSARLHPFVREVILGGRLKGKPRPVHFNTWEAVYFRHEQSELHVLAELAASLGAERFVLDDGWFRGRDDDTRGLGDWTPDPAKYPDGLEPLVALVQLLGMEFGLWVEPEMANADSDLLRAHPDWILGAAGRVQPMGRGQYVLDLARPEVQDNIFSQIDALLRRYPIGYLKWDMNRDLTHAATRRQTLAAYALIDRLKAQHPNVEIESCASGGGRADYEILKRTDRIWTSDSNDPIERQNIQRGFSVFFPPEIMGAHVGPQDSHTTARATSLTLRTMTALLGHFGVEADVRSFSPRELDQLRDAIALYKRVRAMVHSGRVIRQTHRDPGAVATLVTDGRTALASFAQLETPAHPAPAPFRLAGLDAGTRYTIRLLNPPTRPQAAMKFAPEVALGKEITTTGRLLEEVGLPLPILRAGEIAVFYLQAEDKAAA